MIRFIADFCVFVIEHFDTATETACGVDEAFKAGAIVQADIVREENGFCEIQYGDGSVSFDVPRNAFEILA